MNKAIEYMKQPYLFARIQSCCGKEAVSQWDYRLEQWICSSCSAVQSNDPSYLYSGGVGTYVTKDDPLKAKVVHPEAPKKCSCNIVSLMREGCSCKGV